VDETRRLIAAAEHDGHQRLAANHRVVLGHLERIVASLTSLSVEPTDDSS
jgi:hypothetical protein